MEKKKVEAQIIPASFFKSNHNVPQSNSAAPELEADEKEERTKLNLKSETEQGTQSSEGSTGDLNDSNKRTIIGEKSKHFSGLSLSSIKRKREHQILQMEVVVASEDQPHETFTQKQLLREWNKYINDLEKKGQYNFASILRIDTPKLQGENTLVLEYPNETNKIELERSKNDLLIYLRKRLNNFGINLEITVNEELEKQYAYTPKEKFEKMKKKNPKIALLKKVFNLDI